MNIKKAQTYLLDHSIRPSAQRLAIMDYLMENRIHPTVDDIFNALSPTMPTLSKTTVYNTLKLFAGHGAVFSLVIDEKNVRYDIDMSYHGHFQCMKCNAVYDIPLESAMYLTDRIGEHRVLETHLYYKGYCKKCRQDAETMRSDDAKLY